MIDVTAPSNKTVACAHCGTHFRPGASSKYCCTGCEYVARLIESAGLGQYYRLKEEVTAPVGAAAFQTRDYTWLAERVAEAEKDGASTAETVVDIQGISCIGCVWLIERVFLGAEGALRVEVHVQTGRARLVWKTGKFDALALAKRLQDFGYLLGPPGDKPDATESARLAKRIGLCAAFMMNVMLFVSPFWFGLEWSFEYARLFGWIAMLLATLSILVGGTHFIVRAWEGLRRGVLHIDLPIAVGILAAYLGSVYGFLTGFVDLIYFDFVATFIFLMLVGRWVQTYAVERNRQRLLGAAAQPDSVKGIEGSARIRLSELAVGNIYRIPPGRLVPVESRLTDPEAAFSLEWITGEAESRVYRAGQYVPAGAASIGRTDITLTATEVWEQSLLRRLTAGGEGGEFRNLVLERIIRWYMPAILIFAVIGGVWWGVATGDAVKALSVGVAVLVISCPCALGIAAPLADELAVARLRRHGVYVKTPSLWSRVRSLKRVVFDKTGTLTLEYPELSDPRTVSGLDEAAHAALLRLVESSAHPVSRSLHEQALLARPGSAAASFPVTEAIGDGLEGRDSNGDLWRLGRAAWCTNGALGAGTVLSRNGHALATFTFRDTLRADAREEIARLTERGLEIAILSGDSPAKVLETARALGLLDAAALGGMRPEEKAAWVADRDRGDTLMVGDGANDSLAFERAACRGTPVVHRGLLEHKADFYFLGRGIEGVRRVLEVARVRRRVVAQVFALSLTYNVCSVAAALAGWINPLIAAGLMPAISVLTLGVVAWGLRAEGKEA